MQGEHRITTPRRILGIAGIISVLIVAAFAARVGSYYLAIRRGDISALPQFSDRVTRATLPETTQKTAVLARTDRPTLGPESAPLTITLFADFECPFSKEAFTAYRAALAAHPGVRMVFRNFPLEEIHVNARAAARAARCAEAQGKFWAMHDKLFQNAPELSVGSIRLSAEQIGLDLNRFDSCVADPTTDAAIDADLADGVALGVRGTPTFFWNSSKIEGAIPPTVWSQLLSALAAR